MRISFLLSPLLLAAATASAWEWEGDVRLQWQRGFKVDFSGLGAFAPSDFAGEGLRLYDDGFVGTDAFDNAGNRTSYWGYDSAAQTPEGTQTVLFSSASATSDAGLHEDLDKGRGAELAVNGIFWKRNRMNVGLVVGIGYGRVGDDADFVLRGLDASTIRDTYNYGPAREDFIAAAPPGHSGSPSGLGPLLRTDFSRTTAELPNARSIEGQYDVAVRQLTISLGLSGEWAATDSLSLRLEAGLTGAALDADFALEQTVQINELATQTSAFSTRERDTLWGYYGRASARFHLTESAAFSLGLRYADYGELNTAKDGFTALISADRLVFVESGLSFGF